MRLCPLQEMCVKYESGDNKPPNHDVRTKYPCVHFFDYCKMYVEWMNWQGEVIACSINKGRK